MSKFVDGKTISFTIDFYKCPLLYCLLDFYGRCRRLELGKSLSVTYLKDQL